MLKEHDCRRFYEDFYIKDSLFAQNFNCYNIESKITVYFVILNQYDVYFKDQAATKHCLLFLNK